MGGSPIPAEKTYEIQNLWWNEEPKSWYETLPPMKLDVLKDSVSYELWLPVLTELVGEHTDVPCVMKLSKMPFWEMLS